MQVAITCRHGNIRDEVREYISEKSQKLLTYFERVTAIEVTVDFENDKTIKVEILVDTEHKHNFVALDAGEDVPRTFDRAMAKMEQQIRRYKEKLQDHRRDLPLSEMTGPQGTVAEEPGSEEDIDPFAEPPEEGA